MKAEQGKKIQSGGIKERWEQRILKEIARYLWKLYYVFTLPLAVCVTNDGVYTLAAWEFLIGPSQTEA